jgi:hypothetical protein
MHLHHQSLILVDAVQTSLIQPMDQALNSWPSNPQPGLHDLDNRYLSSALPSRSKVLGQIRTRRVL